MVKLTVNLRSLNYLKKDQKKIFLKIPQNKHLIITILFIY